MSRFRVTSNAFALLACSALLFTSFGCSSPGSVTAPDSSPSAIVVNNPNFISILSTSKGESNLFMADASASSMISAEFGGTISNGRVTLEFPPHALDQDTEISIEMLGDGTLGVELSPHGTQFNHPVTMSMDLTGTSAEGNAANTNTVYYNETSDQYELQEKLESDPNTTRSSIRHFSRYAGVGG